MSVLELIKNIAKILNQYANLLLVVITALYVIYTYKMVRIMKRQVAANIIISNIKFGSCLRRVKESGQDYDYLNLLLKKGAKTIIDSQENLRFVVSFYIRNSSSGSGSIDKPQLIFKFPNKYVKKIFDFEYALSPEITEQEWESREGNSIFWKTIDLGETIFIRGGESQKIELKYNSIHNRGNKESYNTFVAQLISQYFNVEYFLRYADNLGEKHEIMINGQNIISDYEM